MNNKQLKTDAKQIKHKHELYTILKNLLDSGMLMEHNLDMK